MNEKEQKQGSQQDENMEREQKPGGLGSWNEFMKTKIFSLAAEMLVILKNNKEFHFGDSDRGHSSSNTIVYFGFWGKVKTRGKDSKSICPDAIVYPTTNPRFSGLTQENYCGQYNH